MNGAAVLPSPPVLTLTGNLLAERTLEFAAWSPGRTQRAARETFQVGGKGINVTRMLERLGVPSTALCFLGGAPSSECEAWLRARPVAFHGFATSRPTRAGTVVRDRGGVHAETTFLGPDVAPDPDAVRACASFLEAQPPGRVLALCGSMPGWRDPEFEPLRNALENWSRRGHLVVDSYGPPLADLARQPLALLMINEDERRTLPVTAASDPLSGLPRWIVTDGPRPVRFREANGVEESITPPIVREISATGSGDVLLAGVIEALFFRRQSLRDAVAFAIPLAAANAAHPGVVEFEFPPATGNPASA